MGNPDSNTVGEIKEKDDSSGKSVVLRETLINHAVNFLLDRKISDQDHSLLRRFLIKKGLTEEEATVAFQRFEALRRQSSPAVYSQSSPPLPYHGPLPPVPVPSMWITVHRVVTTITSIGGIIYAVYWLWKTYISPYLFGRKPKKKPVETSLAELEAAVSCCVTDVKSVRSSIEALAAEKAADLAQGVVVTRIQEVKSEINSLKTLLLNRNQFPATPAPLGTGPLSIPAWQLGAETTHAAEQEEEGSGSNGGTNGSDSSLEIVK